MTSELATPDSADMPMQSTVGEAEARRTRIQAGLEQLDTEITDAYQRRDWQTLGYDSWERYAEENLVSARLRLPREQRRELVGVLREAGMSTRAIASAAGTSDFTVREDLKTGARNHAPDDSKEVQASVAGLDGKSYPASVPHQAVEPLEAELVEDHPAVSSESAPPPEQTRKSHRAPLDKSATNAGWNIRQAVERCQRVVNDDRYPKNKDQVTRALREHLAYTVEIAKSLLGTLPEIDQKTGEVSE